MLIKEIQLRNYDYASRHGLSERIARKRLVKQGFKVYRGIGFFGFKAIKVDYPAVVNKYKELESELTGRLGYSLFAIQLALGSAKGIPDFLCLSDKEIVFVEVKLEHESIKPHQLRVMRVLEDFGFKVMVFRLKQKVFRIETEVSEGQRKVLLVQHKLRRRR
ncbi:MAG: VRR-NUC domain-containing protein [Nanoarchaeota archaeon]